MKPNIERLQMLIPMLHEIPEERLNLWEWTKQGSCGTVACVIGHACMRPEFNELGLTMGVCNPTYTSANGNEAYNWHAVREFFLLETADAQKLFHVCNYYRPDKAMIIDRIQTFIALYS